MLSPLAAATLPLSLGLQGGGLLFEGIGQSQGLKAMAEEKRRQAAEWEAENLIQQEAMQAELDRKGASMRSDAVAPQLATRQAAVQGAGRMGTNLGVGQARQAQTAGALLPSTVVASQAAGERANRAQDMAGAGRMNTKLRQSKLDQQGRAALYDQLLQRAGRKGHWWRQGGQLMQQTGHVLGSIGMGPMGGMSGGQGQPIMPASVSNANIDAETPVDLPLYFSR